MRRKTRIIQISGINGLFMFLFVTSCIIAGFVAFPAIVLMKLWNIGSSYLEFPTINFVQGLMLWAIITISVFILNDNHKYLSAFSSTRKLSDEDIRNIMEKVKLHSQQMNGSLINTSIKNANEELHKDKEKENV